MKTMSGSCLRRNRSDHFGCRPSDRTSEICGREQRTDCTDCLYGKISEVILKYWDKKYQRTADVLVIEGPSAGGHLGFTKNRIAYSWCRNLCRGNQKIKNVVRGIRRALWKEEFLWFLAGGIENHSDVNRALSLGMDGVQVATRFVQQKNVMPINDIKKHI